MEREMETSLENLVRVGTVTWTDPVKRIARVKFEDTDLTSGPLHVLASPPGIPGGPSRRLAEAERPPLPATATR